MKKQTYTVTDDHIAALKRLTKKKGTIRKSEHVRRALDAYLRSLNRIPRNLN